MNIEQAKAVRITLVLDKLGVKPQREINQKVWYLSPLRIEKTPSFKVHTGMNVWYDFGEGKGGDAVSFVCEYLKSINEGHTVPDALRWIENMAGITPIIKPIQIHEEYAEEKTLILKSAGAIEHRLLINYLGKRGIPMSLACKYLKQVRVFNKGTKKSFFALGFTNEEKGYEIRNPFFKGCLGTKAISFIRGTVPKPEGIHIFEGFMDFLSVLAEHDIKRLEDDAIVLNSLSMLRSATPYIKGYGYRVAYSWMDNDNAGQKATLSLDEFFKTEENLKHKAMNRLYSSAKDVNAWRMLKLGLGG